MERLITFRRLLVNDFLSYLNEFTCGLSHKWLGFQDNNTETKEAIALLSKDVTSHDIFMFTKKGCGYCRRAKVLAQDIVDKQPDNEKLDFGVRVVADSPLNKELIAKMLGVPVTALTFPVIFVKNQYVGGSDDFARLVATKGENIIHELGPAPEFDPQRIPIEPSLAKELSKPNVLLTPAREKWYHFQFYVYANVIRAISVIHVVFFALMITLFSLRYDNIVVNGTINGTAAAPLSSVESVVTLAFLFYFILDSTLFICFGPTMSPFGLIATFFIWRYKGNGVPGIPYKVVFGIYIYGIMRQALCMFDRQCKDSYAVNQGLMIANIVNSTMLVFLRF
eukprot:g1093.t1